MSNINLIKGDVINAFKNEEIDCLIHLCNLVKSWGAGIAGQLRTKYPTAWKADQEYLWHGDKRKLGTFTFYKNPENGQIIYNLYAQNDINYKGHPFLDRVNYEKMEEGLIKIKQDIIKEGKKIVGMPLIGCGLAGGNKDKIFAIIYKIFENSEIDLKIYYLS